MRNIRVIPVLLLKGEGLVKTVKFSSPVYIGDPHNAVRIFNDKEVDEIAFLDIMATVENRGPNFRLVEAIAGECFMPLCYGGGINSVNQAKRIFDIGVEKVSINYGAVGNPNLIKDMSYQFGSQSVIASIDVKKNIFGKYHVYYKSGSINGKIDPRKLAEKFQEDGAGEILLNSINLDGTMGGYDTELIQKITSAVDIPVIACGGAGKLSDFKDAVKIGGASAVAAGSMFVFHGKLKGVLINYPSIDSIKSIWE